MGVPSHELSIRMPPQTREARRQTPITITIVLALLCCYYDKNTPTKSLTEERVCCSSQFGAQSIVVRTSRQQDPDTAGHTVSTQLEGCSGCTPPLSSFYPFMHSAPIPARERCCPQLTGFPTPVTTLQIIPNRYVPYGFRFYQVDSFNRPNDKFVVK